MRVRAYLRVSTAEQNCELQSRELHEYPRETGVANRGGLSRRGQWRETQPQRPQSAHVGHTGKETRLPAGVETGPIRALLGGLLEPHQDPGGARGPVHRRDPRAGHGSRFLLHVLGAAGEFERALIQERTKAGQARYKQDFDTGKVGKTVYSRSGPNMPPHRPRKIFDREAVLQLRRQGRSYRQIAKSLGLGLGTVVRTLREWSKSS